MPALQINPAFVPSRIALTAIALALAVLGFAAASAVNASSAAASPNFQAQAKKKCKAVKSPAANRRCVEKTAAQLRRAAAIARRDLGKVGVMSRNLYLGADLGPAIRATTFEQFAQANGEILRSVDVNNFPVRVRGLAAEILSKSPDLVGLQEVSIWRSGEVGPPRVKPGNSEDQFNTRTVTYDYLDLLMNELNKGKQRYRVVKVTTEFDFEGPADYDDNLANFYEINGRLTMRDVIIAKAGTDIKTRNAQGANYETIYTPRVGGALDVTVDRGWGSVEVKVRNSPWFKFVNTHLEAFGDDKNKVVDCMTPPVPGFESNQVSIRCSQAKELFEVAIEPGDLPVVLTGDLNSDDDSVIDDACPSTENSEGTLIGNNGGVCGDTFPFNALTTNGMVSRSTEEPMSCCVRADILTADNGSPADFDHHIDHILTDSPTRVRMLNSSVTGLAPVNGFWNSDHAGVYSLLRINP
ncbi:MAG: endonuclease/exonuclease/phosphatase family protein [Solirubrobacterales bacterium]